MIMLLRRCRYHQSEEAHTYLVTSVRKPGILGALESRIQMTVSAKKVQYIPGRYDHKLFVQTRPRVHVIVTQSC